MSYCKSVSRKPIQKQINTTRNAKCALLRAIIKEDYPSTSTAILFGPTVNTFYKIELIYKNLNNIWLKITHKNIYKINKILTFFY